MSYLKTTAFAAGVPRPCCEYCKKPAPKETEWLEPAAIRKLGTFKTRAELQRVTNQQIVSISYTRDDETKEKVAVWDANTWDGQSYLYPFCTNTCAIKFGQAAFAAGYRLKAK